jgi:AraC family transcriptional activator FtrA
MPGAARFAHRVAAQRPYAPARTAQYGARLMSMCAGAFALAAAGLLDGRRATTHWLHTAKLAARYPAVRVDPDVLYVDEGDILTAAGTAAGVDLCLHVVRRDYGADVANATARRMIVPPHRDGGQAQFIDTPVALLEGVDAFAETVAWARAHLDASVTLAELARRTAMSPSSFLRRFRATMGTSPHRWLLHQRILAAQRLLETTADSVERIADRCGFGSAANLRQHFHRVLRTSPAAYRRTFRHTP